MVSVSVSAGVLIRGHCCALMLELLFGHVSMPAECSAALTVVWAYECACVGCALMLELSALMLELLLVVGWAYACMGCVGQFFLSGCLGSHFANFMVTSLCSKDCGHA